MTYAVAFDATPLSRAALARARDLGGAADEPVVAVACVPDSPAEAREKGWIDDGEYSLERAVESVRAAAAEIAPGAEVRCETVGGGTPRGAVSGRLRSAITDISPDVLFVGSERAGTAATPMDSVAGTLIAAGEYDVYLVRAAEK